MSREIERIAEALNASAVTTGLEEAGPLTAGAMLASRDWFDRRPRKLTSSGGRPTNPQWTLRRQVPLAPETWEALKALAGRLSAPHERFGPGQVAAFLLEDAVAEVGGAHVSRRASEVTRPASDLDLTAVVGDDSVDQRFVAWRQPALFAGTSS